MKDNAHSLRVAKILTNFGGMKVFYWNLTGWHVCDEEIVQFVTKTKHFHGVFSVSVSSDMDVFHTAYRSFDWDEAKTIDVKANELPSFIEWLVNPAPQVEAPVEGGQAPQDENYPCEPSR